jgi:hypothetical protein
VLSSEKIKDPIQYVEIHNPTGQFLHVVELQNIKTDSGAGRAPNGTRVQEHPSNNEAKI